MTFIKIVGCKDSLLWYNDKRGWRYKVLEHDMMRNVYEVATEVGRNIVYEEDACVVEAHHVHDAIADNVTSPLHYNMGGVECIDGIQACMSAEEYQGYLRGNTMKYLWRCNYKGKKVEDLKKAQWYLSTLIEAVGEVH
jgi:hypothetical protein